MLTKSDGETDTLRNWAKRTGLSCATIMYRINTKGMSIDDAFKPVSGKLLLTIDGITLSSLEWSKKTGIPNQTIKRRLESGWTDSQALGFSPQPDVLEFRGELLTKAQIARKLGITSSALGHRIKSGWSHEDAFSIGKSQGGRGNSKKQLEALIEKLYTLLSDIRALKIDKVEDLFEKHGFKNFPHAEDR